MFRKLLTVFFSLNLLIGSTSFAATAQSTKKPRLVLMPVSVSDEDVRLQGAMENALAEGLQEKYTVFSGDAVKKKGREIFEKENKTAKTKCDETKCMEDIALAFNSELLATASVTKQGNDYFLSISIQNIFDNKVIYTKSLAYENHTAAQVINKFKELVGVQSVVNSTPVIEQKPAIPTATNNEESTLWNEIQTTNTIDDYTIYIDTYPKGKYLTLAKARIKKLQDDAITKANEQAQVKEQQSWDTAQSTNTQVSYNQYIQSYPNGKFTALAKVKLNKIKAILLVKQQEAQNGIFYDKSTGLTWQDNEEAKTVTKDWQGAMDYCKKFTLAGSSDWQLPTKDELVELYPKKYSLKNVISDYYWSSSPHISNSAYALHLDFGSGGTGISAKSGSRNVRCVRR